MYCHTLHACPKYFKNVNFLHIKEQVPVTIQSLRSIKETAQMPLPGSFLSQLQQDLDDPQRLGAFNIKHEEERNRRGQDSSEIFWPGNFPLNMRRRSCKNGSHLRIMLSLGHAFKVGKIGGHDYNTHYMLIMFKYYFKNKTREELLSLLASEFDEWANLYPFLSLLASIALLIPISSVHCEPGENRPEKSASRRTPLCLSKDLHKWTSNRGLSI
ncbi:uncharacterized protein [Misgurnus anguillicaudatus]|uniref:uncharacterized protein isoform X1 n=2 Tax=Misgurnus anguillicaudatus TaxID=75329 RepID=UPI003CCF0E1E